MVVVLCSPVRAKIWNDEPGKKTYCCYADITAHIAVWAAHTAGCRSRQRGGAVLFGRPEDVLRWHDHRRSPADRRRAPGWRDGRPVGAPAEGGRRHDTADQRAGWHAADGARHRADRAAVAYRVALPDRRYGDQAPRFHCRGSRRFFLAADTQECRCATTGRQAAPASLAEVSGRLV